MIVSFLEVSTLYDGKRLVGFGACQKTHGKTSTTVQVYGGHLKHYGTSVIFFQFLSFQRAKKAIKLGLFYFWKLQHKILERGWLDMGRAKKCTGRQAQ